MFFEQHHRFQCHVASLCMCCYALLLIVLVPYAELQSDGAEFVELSRDIAAGVQYPLLWGGWVGIPHGALISYLYAPFLIAHSFYPELPIIRLLFVVPIACLLLVHSLLFKIKEIRFWERICASLLFFLLPAFFCFYTLKLWQVVLIPVFTTAIFLSLLKATRSSDARFYALTCLLCGLSLQSHVGSLFLFPLSVAIIAAHHTAFRDFRWKVSPLFYLLGAAPHIIFAFIHEKYTFLYAIACSMLLAFVLSQFATTRVWCRNILRVGVLLTGVLLVLFLFGILPSALHHALEPQTNLLANASRYIGNRNDITFFPLAFYSLLRIETAIIGVYFLVVAVGWSRVRVFDKLLSAYVAGCIIAPVLGALYLFPQRPHQWYIFAFPAAVICVVRFLGLAYSRVRAFSICMLILMLGLAVNTNYRIYSSLAQTGGRGWHMKSLSTKERVVQFVHKECVSCAVYLLIDPQVFFSDHDMKGWRLMHTLSPEHPVSTGFTAAYIYPRKVLGESPAMHAEFLRIASDHVIRHEIDGVAIYLSTVDRGIGCPLGNG